MKSYKSPAISEKDYSLVLMENLDRVIDTIDKNKSQSQNSQKKDSESILSVKNGIANNNDLKIAFLSSENTADFNRETSAFGDPNGAYSSKHGLDASLITSSSCI